MGLAASVVSFSWAASSCAPSDFLGPSSLVNVRILASASVPAYGQPGSPVTMHVLAYDGRPASDRASSPMNFDWLVACEDPANDAYYSCFPRGSLFPVAAGTTAAVAGDGGVAILTGDAGLATDAGSIGLLSDSGACAALGDDAGIPAPIVSSSAFVMPADVVSSHTPTPGATPYGLAFVFNMACAGDAGLLPISPGDINPQQIPFGCYGSGGALVGSDDYTLGFARVYAYPADAGPDGGAITNANPVISGVDVPSLGGLAPCFQGSGPSYVTSPITAKLCVAGGPCPSLQIGPIVPSSSQETNPLTGARELLWVDYFSTFGGFTSNTNLIADPTTGPVGSLDKTDSKFQPPVPGPTDPTTGYVFAVVRDDRGGASWVTVPVVLAP